jgi:hypothetical protein
LDAGYPDKYGGQCMVAGGVGCKKANKRSPVATDHQFHLFNHSIGHLIFPS